MKKIVSICAFFFFSALAFSQVAVDINDSFYSDAQGWELRALTSVLPQLRPYPLKTVERILSDVIENGTEKDAETAKEHYERIFSKPYSFYAEGSGKGRFSKIKTENESDSSKARAAIVEFGIGGDATLHPLVSYAYRIGLFCQTKEFEEYSPLYTNLLADAIFDPTESGPFTNYVTWNANASVGTDSLYGTLGMNRVGFGPFYGDGLTLNDTGYHSANIAFNATREKWSYASVYETIGATRNMGREADDSWLSGNKYLAFHALKWHAFEKFSATYYENIVFGPQNNLSYFAPVPYMGLQNIGGANDNLQMGLLLEYKPVKGLGFAADFFADDIDLNSLFKGNIDSKNRFGVQAGAIFAPTDSIFSKISLNYTAVMPYVYAHWEYDDNRTGSFTGKTWNYQNYTNGGVNIGSTLDPNSDKISLTAQLRPTKNLKITFLGNLIRHANGAEDFSDDEAAEYMLASSGTYATDGTLYMSQMYSNPDGTSGKHVDSAWEKLGFMTSDHKMYIAQAGVSAEYTFAKTRAGKFSLFAGYTFEYVKNNGVNRHIYKGGLIATTDEEKSTKITANGDGTYTLPGSSDKLTWEQLKSSSYVHKKINEARESWVANLDDCMNHYVSVSMKYSY